MTSSRPHPQPTLDRAAEAWTWQLHARCRGEDLSIFFHPDGERGRARKRRQRRAKDICAQCPVAAQCRQHSLSFHERFGTWGGLSEDERDKLLHNDGIGADSDSDANARAHGHVDQDTVAGV
jgi:WhiB family redox-sensing transcriptional regulator